MRYYLIIRLENIFPEFVSTLDFLRILCLSGNLFTFFHNLFKFPQMMRELRCAATLVSTFSGFLLKCRQDALPSLHFETSRFSPWKRKHEADSARRKETKVETQTETFESSVVGKLRKSLWVWEGGWRGDWAVSLAGKEYTGGHLPKDITPIPFLPHIDPSPPEKEGGEKEENS